MLWILKALTGNRQNNQVARCATRRQSFRPNVEALEDRQLMSTFTVLNTNASGPGSLASAVARANADRSGVAIIQFDQSLGGKTINLGGTLTLDNQWEKITITGPVGRITISGGYRCQDFSVAQGTTASLAHLNITHGYAYSWVGGGIYNAGHLSVNACDITANFADAGGGIANGWGASDATVTVSNAYFADNWGGSGGAIGNVTAAGVSVYSSTFHNNNANFGGAISNSGAIYLANNFYDINNAQYDGGAIENQGTLYDYHDVFYKNSAWRNGAAVVNTGTAWFSSTSFQSNDTGIPPWMRLTPAVWTGVNAHTNVTGVSYNINYYGVGGGFNLPGIFGGPRAAIYVSY